MAAHKEHWYVMAIRYPGTLCFVCKKELDVGELVYRCSDRHSTPDGKRVFPMIHQTCGFVKR